MKALARRVRELERLAARRRSWLAWCAKWREQRERERLEAAKAARIEAAHVETAIVEAAIVEAKKREPAEAAVPETSPVVLPVPPPVLPPISEVELMPLAFCPVRARWLPVDSDGRLLSNPADARTERNDLAEE